MITGASLYYGYYIKYSILKKRLMDLSLPDIDIKKFDKYKFIDDESLFWKTLGISEEEVKEKNLSFVFEECCSGDNVVIGIELLEGDLEDYSVSVKSAFATNSLPFLSLPFGTPKLYFMPNDCNNCS